MFFGVYRVIIVNIKWNHSGCLGGFCDSAIEAIYWLRGLMQMTTMATRVLLFWCHVGCLLVVFGPLGVGTESGGGGGIDSVAGGGGAGAGAEGFIMGMSIPSSISMSPTDRRRFSKMSQLQVGTGAKLINIVDPAELNLPGNQR